MKRVSCPPKLKFTGSKPHDPEKKGKIKINMIK
jgi:hypothetical protein